MLACGFLAIFLGMFLRRSEAGCAKREDSKCCTGRNNECYEYTRRRSVCYCDTYCQKTGDCCDDYQPVCQISGSAREAMRDRIPPTCPGLLPLWVRSESGLSGEPCTCNYPLPTEKKCRNYLSVTELFFILQHSVKRTETFQRPQSAIDCVVGSWGPWSECGSLCGVGSKERTRQVSVPPRNGGAPCPDLKQRRGCFGHNAVCNSAREVAKILPDSFKRNFKDPWRRPHMLMKEEKPSYCVYLRVKQASLPCRLGFWATQLVRERAVCVECQGDAMGSRGRCDGEGLEGTRTFWTAASVPGCQGSWVRESSAEECRCPAHSFIFV
ncbi:SBSPO protein, partial [Atractosteus spatula]|nr:SBSPO protein [Atractosteus spatula]